MGSLFAGYEGLGMGIAEVLDVDLAWVSEIEPGPSAVLAHHHPGVPNHGDITTIDWATVQRVHVLTGGFPCQDVSAAGKGAGLRPGTRSGLWSHMAYAIDQLRPGLVIIENVRGLLSADAHCDMEPCPWCVGDGEGVSPLRALGAVLGDLADLGYDAAWCGLRAADVGAPHGRFRIFVVAWPADAEGDSWGVVNGDGRIAGDAADVVREWAWSVRGLGEGDTQSAGGAGGSTVADPNGAACGERGITASGQAARWGPAVRHWRTRSSTS